MVINVAIYGYLKCRQLIYQYDMNLTTFEMNDWFSSEDKFSANEGMALAFGIADYFGDGPKVTKKELPNYIELKVGYTSWGFNKNGTQFSKFEELSVHECSRSELGLDEGIKDAPSLFYPILNYDRKSEVELFQS